MEALTLLTLFLTLLAIIWYTIETKKLREWQTKQVQVSLLQMEINRVYRHAEDPTVNLPFGRELPKIVKDIYENKSLDLSDFYSKSLLK